MKPARLVLALCVAASILGGFATGCGNKQNDKEWTQAPPPKDPNAPIVTKPAGFKRPPAPPSVGGPGGGK